jgi:ketosteroid isomerase-like protein
MRMRTIPLLALLTGAFALSAGAAEPTLDRQALAKLSAQVRDAENSFAKTMADRDLEAFAAHVAEDAVFFGGRGEALHGRSAVVEGWKQLYEGAKAPFSWESAQVEVMSSGKLAHSSGPVRDPEGKVVGNFNSVWRREPNGEWKVIFDKGCNVCNCAPESKPTGQQ